MLRSLMVPLDGSDFSEHSLPLASRLARSGGGAVHLAHVHTPYEPDQLLFTTPFQFEHANVAEYDALRRDKEEDYMSGLAARLTGEGTVADAKVLDGTQVADALLEYADRVGSEMIVITSHGRSGARRLWLGSVTDQIIQRATLPTLVLHPPDDVAMADSFPAVRHILVALDGSKLAESVLGPVSELARMTGARVTLVRVEPSTHAPKAVVGESARQPTDVGVDAAARYLEDAAGALRLEGVTVGIHVAWATSPATAIAEVASQLGADFLALATHGYSGLKRAMLGSVADKLLRSTTLPVLVVRPLLAA
ncbi:MAG: universal stress protein [Gemmatimonadetes bacterium]|nr:universal stress protein [Gemmatimonadota bacterium]